MASIATARDRSHGINDAPHLARRRWSAPPDPGLLDPGAARSRRCGSGPECRLFNDQPRNVPLYQRYGFEIAAEGDVADGGTHVWYMRRRPHPITR